MFKFVRKIKEFKRLRNKRISLENYVYNSLYDEYGFEKYKFEAEYYIYFMSDTYDLNQSFYYSEKIKLEKRKIEYLTEKFPNIVKRFNKFHKRIKNIESLLNEK